MGFKVPSILHVHTFIVDEYWWMENKHHYKDDLVDDALGFNLPFHAYKNLL